jgi:hypothetical protein
MQGAGENRGRALVLSFIGTLHPNLDTYFFLLPF